MRLNLYNNLTKEMLNINNLVDKQTSRIFWDFDITLPEEVTEGEYTYTLFDDNNVQIATGLCQIGDYTPETTSYTGTTNNKYKVYEG